MKTYFLPLHQITERILNTVVCFVEESEIHTLIHKHSAVVPLYGLYMYNLILHVPLLLGNNTFLSQVLFVKVLKVGANNLRPRSAVSTRLWVTDGDFGECV